MLNKLANALMPHYCCSCGTIGAVLCDYCKYDIACDTGAQCFSCFRPVGRTGDICGACKVHHSKGWFVGIHRGALRELISRYKFERVKAAGGTLATLLHETLPELPGDTKVTCVPTVRAHVRARGYDHAELVAKQFARLRGLPYIASLRRIVNAQQRGMGKVARVAQARRAYAASGYVPGRYLLVDDVSTTGATVNYAAKALKDAGAKDVWVATITREPLD